MKKFYEGLYLVRVLSDRPQPEVFTAEDVADLIANTVSGDMVGELVMGSTREVSQVGMASALYAAGSEPGFFQLACVADAAEDLLESSQKAGGHSLVVAATALNLLLEAAGSEKRAEVADDE